MMMIQLRAPREDELTSVVEMLNVCDVYDCGQPDSPFEEIQAEWRAESFCLATDAWVAVAQDERIVGYATLLPRQRYTRLRFQGHVHPAYRGQGIGSRLLDLVERRAGSVASQAEAGARIFLQTRCHETNEGAKRLFEARGLVCVRRMWEMGIELVESPTEPVWPAGVALRPFVVERDLRAVFDAKEEAFRDHWGYLPGDFEEWSARYVTDRAGFDPTLWFIAWVDEQVAGIALCSTFAGAGLVSILGVRRSWRRQGLGLALLQQVFREFYRRGIARVILNVDAENLTGATRLYTRAGMSLTRVYALYEKDLENR